MADLFPGLTPDERRRLESLSVKEITDILCTQLLEEKARAERAEAEVEHKRQLLVRAEAQFLGARVLLADLVQSAEGYMGDRRWKDRLRVSIANARAALEGGR